MLFWFYCLCCHIKHKLLVCGSGVGAQPDCLSIFFHCEYSLHWESWDNIERSVDIKSIWSSTGCCFSWKFIKVDDLPLLSRCRSVSFGESNILFFHISTHNLKMLVHVKVHKMTIFKFEVLVPDIFAVRQSSIVIWTTSAGYLLDTERFSLSALRYNCLCLLIELEDLSFSESTSCLNNDVVPYGIKVSILSSFRNNMEGSVHKESKISVHFTCLWLFR